MCELPKASDRLGSDRSTMPSYASVSACAPALLVQFTQSNAKRALPPMHRPHEHLGTGPALSAKPAPRLSAPA